MTTVACALAFSIVATGGAPMEERAIVKSIEVAAPVAEVWKAWTTSQGLTSFFAPMANVDLQMGGWDPIAKAVYYLDSHNSETLYFGQVGMDGSDFVFTFGPLGGPPAAFGSRGRFKDEDTYATVIRRADSEEIEAFTLKRRR
jgi:hypothetical protein